MFYDEYLYWCEQKGKTPTKVAKECGISDAAPTQWKKQGFTPRVSVQQKLANYFGITIEQLNNHNISSPGITQNATIPVYGVIKAGIPQLAMQQIEGYLVTDLPNPEEYFALKVNGNSMINAGIVNGCSVICHKQTYAEDGQIVACLVDGEDATLKRFKQQGSTVVLIPENPEYHPIVVPVAQFISGEAKILGVVKQIRIDVQ